jgi:flagellar hook-basal body complex protein FliE
MDVTSASAAAGYKAAQAGTQTGPATSKIAEGLNNTFTDFAQTLQNAESAAQASMTGDADPQALVMALAQSQLAVETAVTVRNKVVEAYQEILRMPI